MDSFWHRLARINAQLLVEKLRAIAEELELLFPGPAVMALPVIFQAKGVPRMGEITVQDTETGLRSFHKFFDSEESETTSKTTPTVETSDPEVVLPTVSEDGTSATYVVGHPGSAVVTVTGTGVNDAGEDVPLVSTGLVNVTAGPAVVGSVEFDIAPA